MSCVTGRSPCEPKLKRDFEEFPIILFAPKTTTKLTMSYYSTQIRDSLGREIRVSKEPAPILQNAGLILSQYWLSKCHFFDELFACFGDCLQTVRSPKSSRANLYSNEDRKAGKQSIDVLSALNDGDSLLCQ